MRSSRQIPTIRQVAQACGVSPMTVSFVLNNKRGQVSAETRERVLKAVRELGYSPAAKRVPERRTVQTLGMVAGVAGDSLIKPSYHRAILNGILLAGDHLHQNITLFTHSLFHADTHQSIRVYCDGRCDGLFVVAPVRGSTLVAALQDRGIPFMLVGDTGDEETISCIDLDNVAAAHAATEYLLSQGHRRIGFVGGPDFVRSAIQRLQGYRQAMAAHRVPVNPWFEVTDVVRRETAYRRIQEIMRLPPRERPTALFCWNDATATENLTAITDLGLSVPGDVSVIGIDDDVTAAAMTPPLTTLRQPYEEIGRRAVETLLAQIQGTATAPTRALLPAELIVRASVAPPAGP